MPYSVKKENGKFCVYKKDTNIKVGCTGGTREELKKYLAALHMNESNYMRLTNLLTEAGEDDAASEDAPEEKEDSKPTTSGGYKVKFNAGKVRRYNKIPVTDNEGTLYKLSKDGALVSVDNNTIFVNFEDIIED